MMKRIYLFGTAMLAMAAMADVDLENVVDVKPYANRVYGIRRAERKDAKTIKVVLGATATMAMKDCEAWRIVSVKDPNYAYEKFVRPTSVRLVANDIEFKYPAGRKMSPKGSLPLERSVVELTLPVPMQEGYDYAAVAYGSGQSCVTAAMTGSMVGEGEGDAWASRIVGLRKVSSIGDGKLLCEFGAGYSEQGGNSAANWKVTVNGQSRPVIAMGRRTKLDFYKTAGWPYGGFLVSDVFLDIGAELKDGDKVEVSVADAVTCGEKRATMTFDSSKSVTRSIQANQVGYRTDGIKVAYLSCLMGSMPDKSFVGGSKEVLSVKVSADDFFGTSSSVADAGNVADTGKSKAYQRLHPSSLRLDGKRSFELVDATSSKVVHVGKVTFIHNGGDPEAKNTSNANVWELDFTAFKTNGSYYLRVPGIGRSIAFTIGDAAYQKAFMVQAQGVYCQRCGIEIDPKLADGWRRIACHVSGVVPTTEKRYLCSEWGNFTGNMETVPNPKKAAIEARKAGFAKDPAFVPVQLVDNPKGLGKIGKVPDTKNGVSFVFGTFRDDASGGHEWGGSLFGFTPDANGSVINASWGIPKLTGGEGWRRYGDGQWHVFALTFTAPEGARKLTTCTWYVDGKQIGKMSRNFPMTDFHLGNLVEKNSKGTSFRDLKVFKRVLDAEEVRVMSVDEPDRMPVRLDIRGGHHDAGDYNPRSHMDVAQRLMELFELCPDKFSDSQLNVPERGNGIPDIVDEALWQLRLWVGLQDSDGGVRNGTESQGDPHFFQTVELDDKGDYAWAKDSHASYQCAGAFAQMSRILRRIGRAKEADEMLARAEKAYAWAAANPPADLNNAQTLGKYTIAARAYAAASLYHTTGKTAYHEDFKKNCPWVKSPKSEIMVHGKYDMNDAARQYLLMPENLRDAKLWQSILDAAKAEFAMFKNGCERSPYRFLRNPYAPITWGTGAYENFAVNAGFCYALTGDTEFRDWLILTADNTLGANPLGISWITGLGERTIRCPLHNCRYRPAGVPVPGLQEQGPMQKGAGYSYVDTVYPRHTEGYANMHAWIDTHFAIAMNEPTVNNMVNSMFVFGLLMK